MTTQLGGPLPPGDKHAVSVSIPTWQDTLAWARRDGDLLCQLKTGYPRFFVPLVVRELGDRLLAWATSKRVSGVSDGKPATLFDGHDQLTILFPSKHMATACQRYLDSHGKGLPVVFHVTFAGQVRIIQGGPSTRHCLHDELYLVVYPQQLAVEGKAFWQHTGFGISSRCATFWLANAPFLKKVSAKHADALDLPIKEAEDASVILRNRIGGLLESEENEVPPEAVYLYPTGMSAISHTATALRSLCRDKPGVCRVAVFGFLYVDTFKVLSKVYGFDCVLYGHATPSDLDALETDLKGGLQIDALYTEFPGNPLLGSVDLETLYKLAKEYEFLFVVDDTVATSVNVSLLSFCDMVCTSLTKMFSGACNVMGGSVVLNPQSEHYGRLRGTLAEQFADTYFPTDVLVMERNSADFTSRVLTANRNSERIVEILRQHSAVGTVYYPKGSPTREIYEKYKRPGRGYGYLLSVRFLGPEAAIAFHDALEVAKGPSLGTNFTLCCAYALFAHYSELEWAAKFGVVEHLVRISVGVEEQEHLEHVIQTALRAAEEIAGQV
ncbi:Fc.00g000880.m01.CDS01 [Cosmosporella sp. VM-42]